MCRIAYAFGYYCFASLAIPALAEEIFPRDSNQEILPLLQLSSHMQYVAKPIFDKFYGENFDAVDTITPSNIEDFEIARAILKNADEASRSTEKEGLDVTQLLSFVQPLVEIWGSLLDTEQPDPLKDADGPMDHMSGPMDLFADLISNVSKMMDFDVWNIVDSTLSFIDSRKADIQSVVDDKQCLISVTFPCSAYFDLFEDEENSRPVPDISVQNHTITVYYAGENKHLRGEYANITTQPIDVTCNDGAYEVKRLSADNYLVVMPKIETRATDDEAESIETPVATLSKGPEHDTDPSVEDILKDSREKDIKDSSKEDIKDSHIDSQVNSDSTNKGDEADAQSTISGADEF